jgi:acyl-CoA thioesterase-1
MLRVLSLLLVFAASALPARSAVPPVILVLGDSLSAGYGLAPGQGWVALLQQRLKQEGYGHRVVNASISGETTDGGVARIDRALATHKPEIVIVELGGNDGLRGLPVSRVEENLGRLVTRSRAKGAEVLLLEVQMPANYGPKYTDSFRQAFVDLKSRHDVPVVPLMSFELATNLGYFQPDGIHPNAKAQPLLLDNVWSALTPLLAR